MSDTFTASSGMEIKTSFRGGLEFGKGGNLTAETATALREFFLHERDKELGRWRWPENPSYVVYPHEDGDFVKVLSELSGDMFPRYADDDFSTGTVFGNAARAYFAAHPEPRPWHDAKPGEIWVLRLRDEPEERPYTVGDTGFNGEDIRGEYWGAIPTDSNAFTDGRRIWPEVTP